MPIDYEALRIIWWLLMGILLACFAIMDGFDLGICMMLFKVGKTDDEKRVVLNSIGPVWEGNQVWLVLGGGAIFAAWPLLYSVSFSGFYFAMMLVLFALIIRPVGFKFRSKVSHPRWRHSWDIGLFISGLLPSLLFGVALGNVLQGVPFYFDNMLRVVYTGNLFQLLNPFGLLCGIASIAMLLMQGSLYLTIKTEGVIGKRAAKMISPSGIVFLLLFSIGGIWLYYLPGFALTSSVITDGPSNPLYKTAIKQVGAWLINYQQHPATCLLPAGTLLLTMLTLILAKFSRYRCALVTSSLAIACTIGSIGFSMFPFILPSSTHPQMSLLLWDSSSSHLTLFVMLIATMIFLPLILVYTSWVYRVLRGKVTLNFITSNHKNIY